VLLPDGSSGLSQFEKKLTDGELKRWLSDLDAAVPRDTIVTLPKMHLKWRSDLVPTLEALGATTAFGDDADFSGMAVEPFPGEVPGAIGLKIKKVIHQTFLDVDEQGSEAAAATAVLMDVIVTGARRGPPPPPPFVFRADKPFLFFLRDRRTNLILFMGRYVTPTQE
jgi:serpin B